MEIELLTKELLPALQKVITIVEKKHNLPILSHVLIEVKNNKLKLTATDSEIQIQTINKIQEHKELVFTLYAKNLIDIIKNLAINTKINFKLKDDKIKISFLKNKYTLNTFNDKHFPLLQTIKDYKTITVSKNKLKDLIDKTSFTISNNDIRIYLNGLYFEASNDKLTVVATDGHRLSLGVIEQLNKDIKKETVILPKKTVLEILKLLSQNKKETNIDINISNSYFNISFDETTITSQLINSNFPDYEQVIPINDNKISIDKEQLIEKLKDVIPLVDENKKSVTLNFKNDIIYIETRSEKGDAKTELTIKKQDKNIEVVFNINYLISILEKLITKNIIIAVPDNENKSYLFTNDNNNDYQYVIMPMKI